MKTLLLVLLTFTMLNVSAQKTTATFENLLSTKDSFLNGKTTTPTPRVYNTERVRFSSIYDTASGGYWKGGFAVSSMTDTTDGSFNNLYSSAKGTGAMNSQVYLIGNGGGGNPVMETLPTVGTTTVAITSIYVNNTTYARRIMEKGNMFSRKFTAANKDSFVLWIYTDNANNDSLRVDLANFTHSDTTKNFILDSWVKVEITSPARQLRFKLVSSDNGGFGMNTPNFFALDNIEVEYTVSVKSISSLAFNLYPNPTNGTIYFDEVSKVMQAEILDLNGKIIKSFSGELNHQVNTSSLPSGVYLLQLRNANGIIGVQKFIKE